MMQKEGIKLMTINENSTDWFCTTVGCWGWVAGDFIGERSHDFCAKCKLERTQVTMKTNKNKTIKARVRVRVSERERKSKRGVRVR